jgi:hypothetical protein
MAPYITPRVWQDLACVLEAPRDVVGFCCNVIGVEHRFQTEDSLAGDTKWLLRDLSDRTNVFVAMFLDPSLVCTLIYTVLDKQFNS